MQEATQAQLRLTSNRRRNRHSPLAQISATLVLVSLCVHLSDQLRFTSIQIPALVQRNTNFWLICQFEFNRPTDNQLYSVKWYKRNEEFYRLIMGEGLLSTLDSNSRQQQQQYFPQAGINVMMSQSNATHVRLLNASIESEGTYACEISTQNLSTIRYEREIRVYVLPQTRLQLIGLRTRYSLGDRVELNCSSDFARPAPALSWFINNRRIPADGATGGDMQQQRPDKWFEIETKSSSKFNEPTLRRSSLTLKFKLTSELVAQFLNLPTPLPTASNQTTISTTTTAANQQHQHNQSNLTLRYAALPDQQHQRRPSNFPTSGSSGDRSSASASGGLELRFQCKYKLTEVSDVTFNELLILGPGSSGTSTGNMADDLNGSARDDLTDSLNGAGNRHRQIDSNEQLRANRATSGLRIFKSVDNRVLQSRSPATIGELMRLFSGPSTQNSGDNSVCQLGSLALTPEDPLIVVADLSESLSQFIAPSKSNNEDEHRDDGDGEADVGGDNSGNNGDESVSPGRLPEDENEVIHWGSSESKRNYNGEPSEQLRREPRSVVIPGPSGSSLSVNCTTIGALVKQQQQQQQQQRPQLMTQTATRVKSSKSPTGYCADLTTRRRLAISGKFSTLAESPSIASVANPTRSLSAAGGGSFGMTRSKNQARPPQQPQHHQATNWHQTAYLTLGTSYKWLQQQHQQQQQRQATRNGESGRSDHDPAESTESSGDLQLQLQAPPLLEWFINNQEASRSSLSGQQLELPTLTTATNFTSDKELTNSEDSGGDSTEGASYATSEIGGPSDQPAPLGAPPIDYAQYFANFDSRPIGQHLALHIPQLTSERHYFQAQDSTLRLRCSSTQAQVLAVDSATAVIVAIAAEPNEHQVVGPSHSQNGSSAWMQRQPQQKQWSRNKSNYRNQNPPSASTGGYQTNHHSNYKSNGSSSSTLLSTGHYLCTLFIMLCLYFTQN